MRTVTTRPRSEVAQWTDQHDHEGLSGGSGIVLGKVEEVGCHTVESVLEFLEQRRQPPHDITLHCHKHHLILFKTLELLFHLTLLKSPADPSRRSGPPKERATEGGRERARESEKETEKERQRDGHMQKSDVISTDLSQIPSHYRRNRRLNPTQTAQTCPHGTPSDPLSRLPTDLEYIIN